MPYLMEFYVGGVCRGNGRPDAFGAAAACLMTRERRHYALTALLPLFTERYRFTSQRAELWAIIIALEWAQEKSQGLYNNPYIIIKIHSDSRYAIGCISDWIYEWKENGWINADGDPVANRDLIERAVRLDTMFGWSGRVQYIWVPREKNNLPAMYCNEAVDEYYRDDDD